MVKGQRKFWMYILTLVGTLIIDYIATINSVNVPFDGMTISGLFAFAVAGTTAEHLTKKQKPKDGGKNKKSGKILIAIMARLEQIDKKSEERNAQNDKAHDEINKTVTDIWKALNGNGKPGINGRRSRASQSLLIRAVNLTACLKNPLFTSIYLPFSNFLNFTSKNAPCKYSFFVVFPCFYHINIANNIFLTGIT
ncbi:MAG: hypothetical protein LLG37_09180 [Spirochaetia bacterium]|nr:hypothetical protein [Spirochaetia bacterium]